MTRMPPQAYTKEVLASAFDWLSRQNENVKKSIRNSDDLVGLYLKSTRLKENQNSSAPSSSGYSPDLSSAKSFRSELQGLALNLKQFEDKPVQEPPQEPMSDYLHELNLMMSAQVSESPSPNINAQPVPTKHHTPVGIETYNNTHTIAPTVASTRTPIVNTPPPPTHYEDSAMTTTIKESPAPQETAETVLLKLDKKTISAINLAKERLNLSSNTEAIRVLVSLGEKHLKKIFGTEE